MGGISAIFGLGRRQQEKVTAAALEPPASRPPPGKRPPACWAATVARPPTGADSTP